MLFLFPYNDEALSKPSYNKVARDGRGAAKSIKAGKVNTHGNVLY